LPQSPRGFASSSSPSFRKGHLHSSVYPIAGVSTTQPPRTARRPVGYRHGWRTSCTARRKTPRSSVFGAQPALTTRGAARLLSTNPERPRRFEHGCRAAHCRFACRERRRAMVPCCSFCLDAGAPAGRASRREACRNSSSFAGVTSRWCPGEGGPHEEQARRPRQAHGPCRQTGVVRRSRPSLDQQYERGRPAVSRMQAMPLVALWDASAPRRLSAALELRPDPASKLYPAPRVAAFPSDAAA
jgi:hypothetical protein